MSSGYLIISLKSPENFPVPSECRERRTKEEPEPGCAIPSPGGEPSWRLPKADALSHPPPHGGEPSWRPTRADALSPLPHGGEPSWRPTRADALSLPPPHGGEPAGWPTGAD